LYEKFNFLIHLLHQEIFPNFRSFEVFLDQKNHLKNCIFFKCMMITMEEQLYSFYQIPDSKNHWEGKYFLNFFVSRNVFKRGDFCQFLASKIHNKIWDCFNIFCNFVSQKILTCLQWLWGFQSIVTVAILPKSDLMGSMHSPVNRCSCQPSCRQHGRPILVVTKSNDHTMFGN